jgi:hypothetical protein
LEKIVSKSQNALIRDRQILDHVLIVNECLDSRIINGEPDVLYKLDLEKAYDHVNWHFMLYMLRMCGFGGKWYSWIAHCVFSVQFSILVNDTPSGFFSSSRGLREDDSFVSSIVCYCDGGFR